MKRFFPLAPSSGGSPRSSVPGRGGIRKPETSHASHSARQLVRGFTLIELLVVVAVIAILAGLTISILGAVQGKGARSRAQTEVASISAAIDSYFLDNEAYPPMDPGGGNTTSQLFAALCGGEKIYFEPKATMLQTNATQTNFVDPWGELYLYSTNPTEILNVGSFDFWSRAGTTNKATDDIRN